MKRIIKLHRHLFIPILLVTYLGQTLANVQTPILSKKETKTIFKELQTTDHLTIRTNLDSLLLNKKKNSYQKAKLVAVSNGIEKINLSIKIRCRGKSRRNMCEMPPLKLNFKKEDLANLGINQNFDKLKLVTHCQLDGEMENLIVKEYWAYRFYNELSPNSFRAKLIKITYIHELDDERQMESFAIIIENSNEMAHRIGGTIVKQYGLTPHQLVSNDYHNLLVFNYMIGNTDWAVRFQQNIKLVKIEGQEQFIPIPYDFDQAKIVDAPYRSVNSNLRSPRKDNRYRMDPLNDPLVLANNIEQFKNFKKEGFKIHENCSYLKKKDKKKMSRYLESFYALL